MTDTEAPKALSESFRALLDSQGHGFHYAVLRRIGQIGSLWQLDEVEFPVSYRGGTVHIDFILKRDDEGPVLRMVAECKRANPARVDWCFVRRPYDPLAKQVQLEAVRVNRDTARGYTRQVFAWPSKDVYHLALPVKGQA